MSEEQESVLKKVLELQEKIESCETELRENNQAWTDALDELSEIEKAFETKDDKLHGKTILDIGTYGIKPLYIALKYEPETIIGINEEFPDSVAADVEQKSKLFVTTKIKFYECSFFNKVKLKEIKDREDITEFDFILLSKTLHHLRSGECIAEKRDPEHTCRGDEECCIYKFDEKKIFKLLLGLGKRLIVYECFTSGEDIDKEKGRGGHFTIKEWKKIFKHLANASNYRAELIQPSKCSIDHKNLENVYSKLRQVDCICFYVEKKEK